MAPAAQGRLRVVAHCRADPRIGMGHAVRLGALLHHFPPGADLVCCVDRELAGTYFPKAATFRPADRAAVYDAVREGASADAFTVLLVDLPRSDAGYWQLGGNRVLTVAIDDNGGLGIAADIVVNQSDIARTAEYPDLPAYSVVLSGLSSVLLRHAFAARTSPAPTRGAVGIVAGSGDLSARWVTDVIRNLRREAFQRVGVVISNTLPNAVELTEIGCSRSIDVATGQSAEEMRDFYRHLDLCIMTGGSAIFEAMATGTPVLCHPILDDMFEPTRLLASMGGLIALPLAKAGPGAIEQVILDLLADRPRLQRVGAKGASLIDGRGCERVAALIGRVASRCASGHAKSEAVAMEKVA